MNEPKRRGRPPKAALLARKDGDDHIALIKSTTEATFQKAAASHEDALDPRPMAVPVQGSQPVDSGASVTVHHEYGYGATDDAMFDGERNIPFSGDLAAAQAYAMRVWSGQSDSIKRAERIARCESALKGQNLPTEGIKYPGSADDDEWTEDDMKPVTWRKAGA